MTPYEFPSFIIIGVTSDGGRFRPSDWAERLAGALATYNFDRRMVYSPHVQPGQYDGHPCVFVNAAVREAEPMAYAFLANFARDNGLKIQSWEP